MNKSLFSKLALDGIKKNRKLYFPYILSIIGVVMIYYILAYLSASPALSVMGGGENMRGIMLLGKIVMILFSILFLTYTNAFLTKRRNREFALYNILGMNKSNVLKIVGRESLVIGLVGIGGGTVAGILLSKLFEIALLKVCEYPTDTVIYFPKSAIIETIIFFAVILLVLYIITGARIIVNKPIELLHSTSQGEKEPKSNIVMALLGAVLLGVAYYFAVSIKNPAVAIGYFFIAVLMVIVATYLLFISGSVFVCKLLKKNKAYYYNPKHYVSVSGMMYRMKRNGAGLASICILSTMVLVMLSSAGSLYFGEGDSLKTMYPYDIEIVARDPEYSHVTGEYSKKIEDIADDILKDEKVKNLEKYNYVGAYGKINGNTIVSTGPNHFQDADFVEITAMSVEEYNNRGGEKISLNPGEILFDIRGIKFNDESLCVGNSVYNIAGTPDSRVSTFSVDIVNSAIIITNDLTEIGEAFSQDEGARVTYYYEYGFDVDATTDHIEEIYEKIRTEIEEPNLAETECRAVNRSVFMELYGGLFILGIFLSVAFIGACILIMYYKQIMEGYEDAHNYDIMKKVGMTKDEIKRGINSQTLVTFYSPLFVAGLHLLFAYPMISSMLMLFGIFNKGFVLVNFLVIFAVFTIVYLFVYKKTVRSYLEIVDH